MSRTPTLRVASGAWKGRRLDAPSAARPTTGRARAALFDILQQRIPGARLLELTTPLPEHSFEARPIAYVISVATLPGPVPKRLLLGDYRSRA